MQDRKNNLSIFNFNNKQLRFIKVTMLFIAPIVIILVVLELLVLNMPANYKYNSAYFEQEKELITTVVFGSSQMDRAINPTYIGTNSISFASKSQHHGLDNAIFTQTFESMPKITTVVFELSYAHLEIAHNDKEFWKNNIYLKYFDVNAFGRNTYFKDKLLFISSPEVYSRLLGQYYLKNQKVLGFNKYGNDTTDFKGTFKKVNYLDASIKKIPFQILTKENPNIFKYNTQYFLNMLKDAYEKKLNVIICTLPLEKNYLKARNPGILRRRDSILKIAENTFPNVRVFRKEEDTINFDVTDFLNHNHLNPTGAKKYSIMLDSFIKDNFPN